MRLKRPVNDLLAQLKDQVDFLTRSAQAFDAGHSNEALQMALRIRVLLHDTQHSRSLLGQLGKKNLKFYDTAYDYDPDNLAPQTLLTPMQIGGDRSYYVPRLDDLDAKLLKKKLQFWPWWNKVVIADKDKNTYTRQDLVLTLADQDGGAHVDPHLEEKYVKLSRLNSLGWKYVVNGVERPFERPDFPSLRQITHEVLKTLKDEFPKLLEEVEHGGP
jgi:hypothetical protein